MATKSNDCEWCKLSSSEECCPCGVCGVCTHACVCILGDGIEANPRNIERAYVAHLELREAEALVKKMSSHKNKTK